MPPVESWPDWVFGVGIVVTVLVLGGLFALWLLVRARDVVAAEREELGEG
jgi:hypothetical protein